MLQRSCNKPCFGRETRLIVPQIPKWIMQLPPEDICREACDQVRPIAAGVEHAQRRSGKSA